MDVFVTTLIWWKVVSYGCLCHNINMRKFVPSVCLSHNIDMVKVVSYGCLCHNIDLVKVVSYGCLCHNIDLRKIVPCEFFVTTSKLYSLFQMYAFGTTLNR